VYGLRDFIDGSSNTVAFAENLIGDNNTARRNTAEYYNCVAWPGSASGSGSGMVMPDPTAVSNLKTYVTTCYSTAKSAAGEQNNRGQFWAAARFGQGPLFSTLQTPNSQNSDCQNTNDNGTITARSQHPGGVNTLFADGSVKFIKSSINQTTWWALGSRDGGEVISADAF